MDSFVLESIQNLNGIMKNSIECQKKISELSQSMTDIQSRLQKELNNFHQHLKNSSLAASPGASINTPAEIMSRLFSSDDEQMSLLPSPNLSVQKTHVKKIVKANKAQKRPSLDPSQPAKKAKSVVLENNKVLGEATNAFDKIPCGIMFNKWCLMTTDRSGLVNFWNKPTRNTNDTFLRSNSITIKNDINYVDNYCLMENFKGHDQVFFTGYKGKETFNANNQRFLTSCIVNIPSASAGPKVVPFTLNTSDDITAVIGTESLPIFCVMTADVKKQIKAHFYSPTKIERESILHSEHTACVNDLAWKDRTLFSCGADGKIIGFDVDHSKIICQARLNIKGKAITQIEQTILSAIALKVNSTEKQIGLFDPRTNNLELSFGIKNNPSQVGRSKFTLHNYSCLLSDNVGVINTWDLRNGKEFMIYPDIGRIDFMAVHDNQLATCGYKKTFKIQTLDK